MADEREMEEHMLNMIHGSDEQASHSFASQQQGAHQEHEEEDDGSQYLALEQGEQELGDDNAGEVLK
jgi:hypothetical protein